MAYLFIPIGFLYAHASSAAHLHLLDCLVVISWHYIIDLFAIVFFCIRYVLVRLLIIDEFSKVQTLQQH